MRLPQENHMPKNLSTGATQGRLLTAALGAGLFFGVRAAIRAARTIDLRDKAVVITGGSRGLGLVLARTFADQGSQLALLARDADELADAETDLRRRGANVYTEACDVTDQQQVQQAMENITDRFGRIDVLVNNAGSIQVGPMELMTIGDYEEMMKIHFWGPLYTTLSVLSQMRRRGEGRIVNISSIGGKIAAPHLLPYSASKFALVGFSEGLRSELLKEGIYVTTVCPGLMRTGSPRNATFKGQHRKEYAWFAISDAMPGVSISAKSAARRIVRACKNGESEIMVSFPARLATTIHGIFPGVTADVNALLNRLLPGPGGIGRELRKGKERQSRLAPSILTALNEKAAVSNNEM